MKTYKQFINQITEELIKQGDRLGSNPGGLHVDNQTGKMYYVKHPKNPDQAKVEVLASKIHDLMGIKNTNPSLHYDKGNHSVISEWNPHLKPLTDVNSVKDMSTDHHKTLANLYAAGVLLKNWDSAGSGIRYGEGNIMQHKKTGELYSIDPGGSLMFRAQGGAKPYTPDVSEIHSLRDENMSEGAPIFNTALSNPEAHKHMIDTVKNLDNDKVREAFRNSGLDNWEDLHNTFNIRKSAFLKHYENDNNREKFE